PTPADWIGSIVPVATISSGTVRLSTDATVTGTRGFRTRALAPHPGAATPTTETASSSRESADVPRRGIGDAGDAVEDRRAGRGGRDGHGFMRGPPWGDLLEPDQEDTRPCGEPGQAPVSRVGSRDRDSALGPASCTLVARAGPVPASPPRVATARSTAPVPRRSERWRP